jgi:DNA-binding SARP family transcriptional activator
MGTSVETSLGNAFKGNLLKVPVLRICLLGSMQVRRDGAELPLPASRKARALLALLAVSPQALTRSRLCELLWDIPDDPRGELRWCLSKLRKVLDSPERHRIEAPGDAIGVDLSDCFVDVKHITRALESGLEHLSEEQLRDLDALFVGDFAEGVDIDRSAQFGSWLDAQRRRFRAVHIAVLEQLVKKSTAGSEESFKSLEKWLQLAPFDVRAHDTLLSALWTVGRIQEAEQHLATTIRSFEAEGLEWLPIRERWRSRKRASTSQPIIVKATELKPASHPAVSDSGVLRARRASICVMPFVNREPEGARRDGWADGLTEDIITRLAKLRALFVIARGSVYALHERSIPPEEAGRLLNVDYVASGTVRRQDNRISVAVELSEARVSRIVWAEEFNCKIDDVLLALDEIGNRIVASIAEEIESSERNRALLKPPNSLDGWEAYHRGLWHMYRFNDKDNERALHFFEMAVRRDPTFARAYAGLSFAHFQNAFLHRAAERDKETDLAYEAAGQSLIADDRDPAAHWAMGRALWLRGRQDESLVELEQCVKLSPNFALGHYTIGFVQCQSGDARAAIASADYSRYLSPFDPLMFAMLSSRALAHVRLGQYKEAAEWSLKGAARPNAHAHILAIAANCLALDGQIDEARKYVKMIGKTAPDYGFHDFLGAFRFSPDAVELFRRNAPQIGLG